MHIEIDDQDEAFAYNNRVLSFIFVFNLLSLSSISSFYANISSLYPLSMLLSLCRKKKRT